MITLTPRCHRINRLKHNSVQSTVLHEDLPVQDEGQLAAQGGSHFVGFSFCQFKQFGDVIPAEAGQSQNEHVGFFIDDAVPVAHKVMVLTKYCQIIC